LDLLDSNNIQGTEWDTQDSSNQEFKLDSQHSSSQQEDKEKWQY